MSNGDDPSDIDRDPTHDGIDVLERPHGGWPLRWLPLIAIPVLLALLGGLLLGRSTGERAEVVKDRVSVGFAHDMIAHHAQAVRMSEIVHRRSAEADVAYLAFDILSTQHGQIGIMSGWLSMSGQAASSTGPAMAWMGQAHAGPMPGMASDAEIQALETLPVPQMTEQYLRLMIRHHRGALPMATYAADHAENTAIARLAEQMNAGQSSEIELMQRMLTDRSWIPEPDSGDAAPADAPSSPAGTGEHVGH